jgi:hypothetical protein
VVVLFFPQLPRQVADVAVSIQKGCLELIEVPPAVLVGVVQTLQD